MVQVGISDADYRPMKPTGDRDPFHYEQFADESFCYLTTRGRVTGKARTIEIWFGLRGDTAYLLSGGRHRSDWVQNIVASRDVTLRVGDRVFEGQARIVTDPDEERMARDLLLTKYRSRYGGDLSGWRERALPVAVDLKIEDVA